MWLFAKVEVSMASGQAKIERLGSAEQEAYWRGALRGDLPYLSFGDYSCSPVPSFLKKRESTNLDALLVHELEKFCTKEGVGSCVALLATFNTLRLRYTGQEDVITGSLFSDAVRESEGYGREYFTNPVALRTHLTGDTTVREYLRRVAVTVENAAANRDYPFDKVIELAGGNGDLSRPPLFQVMCIFRDMPLCDAALPALGKNLEDVEEYTTRCDLVVIFSKWEAGLRIDCEFDAELFERATIARLFNHFRSLLEGFIHGPERRLSTLPLLTEAERHQLLVEWNDTERDYPRNKCIHQLFEAQVERSPDAEAVVFEDQQLTYQELNSRANQLAHYLRKLGVRAETPVAICMERSLEMPVVLLAVLKAGGAYLPLDWSYPEERLAFMLEDARVSIVLTQNAFIRIPPHGGQEIVRLDAIQNSVLQESVENLETVTDSKNLAYVIYTSGSTGKPKGVQVQHGSVMNFLNSMREKPGLSKEDTLLAVTTLSFDIAGLEMYLPLVVGGRVALVSREAAIDGAELLRKLERHSATVMQSTSATWRLLLEAGWTGRKHLKVLCGGEMLPQELAAQLLDKGSSVWNLYGPTETTIWSAIHQVVSRTALVPVGRPIDNTQIFILDAHLELVPIGVAGELYIGGTGVARGYLNQPELSAESFVPSPFSEEPGARLYRTGDLARYRQDGTIECLGRIDHQVKVRGFRIELGEIEAALRQHPGVKETVVVALEVRAGDKRLVAYVVLSQRESVTTGDLRDFLKQKVPGYMVPSTFVTLDSLPLTPNGKVDRRALPVTGLSELEPDRVYVPPQNELEKMIVKIWQQVLNVEKVGTQDNFFDLGGHSLLMMQVNQQLKDVIGRNIPIVQMFRYPTVLRLARSLSQDSDAQPSLQQSASRGQTRRESMMRQRQPRNSTRSLRNRQGA
jgi:amino acid adenylation domain-containing protein